MADKYTNVPVSKPPTMQLRVYCPLCNHNNGMAPKHKEGDKVQCSNCFHDFIIGSA